MTLSHLLPRAGDSLRHYLLFYVVGCSITFPTIYYLLLGDWLGNLNFEFLAARSIQGILFGAASGLLVYGYENSREAHTDQSDQQ